MADVTRTPVGTASFWWARRIGSRMLGQLSALVRTNPTVSIALIAATVAAEAWGTIEAFYRPLGFAPQETGVTSLLQPIVEGAAVVAVFDAAFVVLLVLATAYVGCWLFALNDTWRMVRRGRSPHRASMRLSAVLRKRRRDFPRYWRWMTMSLAAAIVLGLGATAIILPAMAAQLASQAQSGQGTSGMVLGPFDVFPFRALPVEVRHAGDGVIGKDWAGDCLLLIGQANTTTAIYDATKDVPFRLPSDGLALMGVGDDAACKAVHLQSPPPAQHHPQYVLLGIVVALAAIGTLVLAVLLPRLLRHPPSDDARSATRRMVITDIGLSVPFAVAAWMCFSQTSPFSLAGIVLAGTVLGSIDVLLEAYRVRVGPAHIPLDPL